MHRSYRLYQAPWLLTCEPWSLWSRERPKVLTVLLRSTRHRCSRSQVWNMHRFHFPLCILDYVRRFEAIDHVYSRKLCNLMVAQS